MATTSSVDVCLLAKRLGVEEEASELRSKVGEVCFSPVLTSKLEPTEERVIFC